MNANDIVLFCMILGPVLFGALSFIAPARVRSVIVAVAGLLTIAGGLALVAMFAAGKGSFSTHLGEGATSLPILLEGLVCLIILAVAVRIRSVLIALMALAQVGMVAFEFMSPSHSVGVEQVFRIDMLAVILTTITCVIGGLIVLYAIGYMRDHEHHAPPTAASNGQFFLFLIGFLGAMNGLVMANSLVWLSTFWELTTLCSFALIGHDGTEEARRNAKRALLLNSIGGVALIGGSLIASHYDVTTLSGLTPGLGGVGSVAGMFVLAMMALAGMTKSAQMPFQSWLLGAMVAPTPVSALLHSATMVNAGVYVILRLAPAFQGTAIMSVVALAGAFTFALTSALAIGQSNGKKVLAYSTIANLGLIVTCAGIGTPLAYTAAIMILCFHAASKGLLFLCMGTIEQQIGSRDIEDMGSLLREMPFTTAVTLVGMASMLIPPFGMLLSKWLAIEASVSSLANLFLLVIGSAFTVLFWAKWIGRITTVSYHPKYTMEKLQPSKMFAMAVMCAIVIVAGLLTLPAYSGIIVPTAAEVYRSEAPITPALAAANIAGESDKPVNTLAATNVVSMATSQASKDTDAKAAALARLDSVGRTLVWPFYLFVGLVLLIALLTLKRLKPSSIRQPYLCGENITGSVKTYEFRSAMDKGELAWTPSFYFKNIFDEVRITRWANLAALAILVALFGVIKYVF